MKKLTKLFGFAILTMVIFFSMTACSDEAPKNYGENPYKGEILVVLDEQVSEHTDSNRISGAYQFSSLSGYINIYCLDDSLLEVGSITEGKLSFTLGKPETLYDTNGTVFKTLFSDWWNNITVIEPTDNVIKGNAVKSMWIHGDEGEYGLMFKEKLVGTSSSLALEDLVFIYVDGDCRITGNEKTGMVIGTGYFNSKDFDLSLKQGWNIVCRTMLYGSEVVGYNIISMEIKNLLDFKWAMWEYH